MANNAFTPDELVKVQGKEYPVVGGRLRLCHEENKEMSSRTELIKFDGEVAVVKAVLLTEKGEFTGYGLASVKRDRRLADAILELAETRSIARALRFAGYGVEYTGAEEMSHLAEGEPKSEPKKEAKPEPKEAVKAEPKKAMSEPKKATAGKSKSCMEVWDRFLSHMETKEGADKECLAYLQRRLGQQNLGNLAQLTDEKDISKLSTFCKGLVEEVRSGALLDSV